MSEPMVPSCLSAGLAGGEKDVRGIVSSVGDRYINARPLFLAVSNSFSGLEPSSSRTGALSFMWRCSRFVANTSAQPARSFAAFKPQYETLAHRRGTAGRTMAGSTGTLILLSFLAGVSPPSGDDLGARIPLTGVGDGMRNWWLSDLSLLY
jgi:hypothetical protein